MAKDIHIPMNIDSKQMHNFVVQILNTHKEILKRLDESEKRQEDFIKLAFPGGDIDGHNRYHTELIENLAARKAMYKAIAEKTFSGIIWSLVVALGYVLWHGVIVALKPLLSIKGG